MRANAVTTSESKPSVSSDGWLPGSRNAYRLLSVTGLVLLTALALAIVTTADVHRWPALRSLFGDDGTAATAPTVAPGVLATTVATTLGATLSLCKPHPRRILDTISATIRALLVVTVTLATVGYFTRSFGLPRSTLIAYVGVLAATVPVWFVFLQQWQLRRGERTVVVGNNPKRIEAAVQAAAEPVAGYAFSPTETGEPRTDGGAPTVPEKLASYECLGGLSRLDAILQRSDVGTVIPALPQTDRAEFFGVLEACHRHDVNVKILTEHDESVLIEDEAALAGDRQSRLIGINMQPFDLQTRVLKRLFDVTFACVGLLLLLPLWVFIVVAIKLDSSGPVFYEQERTTQFGDTFTVYKFRSMKPESEVAEPGEDAARITRVGRLLRRTHLDELPQLWAILGGKMSVVGPRAAWTAEEEVLQREMETWKKRWFVKPGLTGLAQINEASSEHSRAKLQYDLTYIKNQSFWFDLKIVVRQLWMVGTDVGALISHVLIDRLRHLAE